MIPDIVEIKRLCASGQWLARIENGKILLHDTVAGETVCIGQTGAEPVRHGHWTEDGCCSECGKMGLYNGNEEIVRSRYCPYCGEKMDGGDPHD